MKKHQNLIFFSVILIGLMLLLCSCGCEHEWQDATCITPTTCTLCGETAGNELGHTYQEKITTEPDCAHVGSKTLTCTVCEETHTEEIPATGNHDYKFKAKKKPTCTTDGLNTYTCSTCGDSYDETPPATSVHDYKNAITAQPTCIKDGVRTYTCSMCKDAYTEKIPMTGNHNYKSTVKTQPSCKAAGLREYQCSDCDDSYTESIPKLSSHSYTSKVTTAATCTADGVKTYTCSVCADSYTEKIKSPGSHTYTSTVTTQASCTGDGVRKYTCSVCRYSYTQNFSQPSYSADKVYNLAKNSIGEIITYDERGSELALGTCFVYTSDGQFITNFHVIEDARSAKITLNGRTYTVSKILAYDKTIDLAVLKVNASGLTPVTVCKKTHAVGKSVFAFGSSQGLTATFSQGIITYANRILDGVSYVQHDAAISSGNSGGPLINEYGEVIGINTMTIKDSQNLNFAISTTELNKLNFSKSYTFEELFGSNSGDVFTTLKNYIIRRGTYDSSDGEYDLTLGTSYSSDYTSRYTRKAIYNSKNDTISLWFFINAECLISISIDEVDGVYTWTYYDENDYYIIGTLYASTYTSSTLLGYYDYNIYNSSLRSTIRELASAMMTVLCSYLDSDFSSIGISAEDLGFTYF